MSEKNFETVLREIVDTCGIDMLADGRGLVAAFCDLSDAKKDQRMLRYFVEAGGHTALFTARNLSPAMQQTRLHQTINKMCSEMLISEEAARQVCNAFWNVLGGSAVVEKKEESCSAEPSDHRKKPNKPETVMRTPPKQETVIRTLPKQEMVMDISAKPETSSQKTKRSGAKVGIGLLIAALFVALVFLPMLPKGEVFTLTSYPQTQTEKQHGMNSTEKAGKQSEVKAKSGVLREDPMQYGRDGDGHLKTFPVFGTELMRDQVSSITFLSTLEDAPENVYDLSAAGDGSVLGWAILNGELYDLYIATEGGVKAPSNCQRMFAYYKNVWCINFNDSFDTSDTTNMSGMFEGCNLISLVDIECLKTSKVTDMSGMFDGCGLLTRLDVSGFDTSHVTNMDKMFYGCTFLRELNLSSFDTSCVTSMNGMFAACGLLTQLDLSGFDTARVTSMNSMFSFCTSLNALDVSSFNTENVRDMSSMFHDCSELKNLDLRTFHTSSLENMYGMFTNCHNLTKLDLSAFDTTSVEKMSEAFLGCDKLKNVSIPIFDVSNVTSHRKIMNEGAKINGRRWEEFFPS